MNKYIQILTLVFCALLLGGEIAPVGVEAKNFNSALYSQVSWTSIKLDDDRAHPRAQVSGYLRFDGEGDFPGVSLWEDLDKLKEERIEYSVMIESQSFMRLVNKRFGEGANNWKVLSRLYVEVYGVLKCHKDDIWIKGGGTITDIERIEIKNNGLVLMVFQKD